MTGFRLPLSADEKWSFDYIVTNFNLGYECSAQLQAQSFISTHPKFTSIRTVFLLELEKNWEF